MHDTGIPIVYLPTHVHRHAYTWHALEGGVGKKSNNEVVCVCEPQTLAADLHLHERKRAWEKESLGERARVRSCICAWGRARAMKCLLCTWFNVTSRATLLIDVVFYAKRNSSVTLLKTPFTCMMQTISSKITNHLSPYPPKPRSTRPRYLPKWERSLCYGAHRATTLSEFYFAERKKKERIHGCSNYNENISSLDLFIHLKVKESGVMFWVWSCSVYHFAPCICIAVHEQKLHPLIMVVWGDSRPKTQWSVVTDWIPNYAMIGWGGGLCSSMTFSVPEPEYISLVCRDGNIASKIKSEPGKLPYDCHYQVGLDFSAWILQAYWLGFDFRNFHLSVSDCSVHEMTLIVFRG